MISQSDLELPQCLTALGIIFICLEGGTNVIPNNAYNLSSIGSYLSNLFTLHIRPLDLPFVSQRSIQTIRQ